MILYLKDINIDWAVFRTGLSSSGNDTVFEGIDPLDRSLQVIKEILIKNKTQVPSVNLEFYAYS